MARLPNPDFWRGKRVLLTGCTGFKGAWLTLILQGLGAEVRGVALAPTTPSLWTLLGEPCPWLCADLRDPDAAPRALAAEPDVVLHLAAQALVRAGHRDPLGTYGSNLMGTVAVLEAVRAQPSVRAALVVTTDKVYRPGPGAHREGDPLGGIGPYSASKVCAEVAVEAAQRWAADRGLGLLTARAGNTLGGGDYAEDRLVPDCIRAAEAGRDVVLRHPLAVRPWQHVLDVLVGYLLLAERAWGHPEDRRPWNLGPASGDEPSVGDVARAVLAAIGHEDRLVIGEATGPAETAELRLDSTRANTELGWQPRLDGQQTVAWTAAWYRRAPAEGARAVCDEQIRAFQLL